MDLWRERKDKTIYQKPINFPFSLWFIFFLQIAPKDSWSALNLSVWYDIFEYLNIVTSCEKKQHQNQRSNHPCCFNTKNCSTEHFSSPLIRKQENQSTVILAVVNWRNFGYHFTKSWITFTTYLACNSYQKNCRQGHEEAWDCSLESSHEVNNAHKETRIEYMSQHVT